MAGALESLSDPLIDPILALLKDGINADVAALVAAVSPAASDTRAAVLTTKRRPFVLPMEGEGVLPALHCYRVRTRSSQFSIVHTDHTSTLQFTYATPACEVGSLDARWALLDRVWRMIVRMLKRGKHPAHEDGDDVLEAAGVIRTNLAASRKLEVFLGSDAQAFPGFIAEVDVTWRDAAEEDPGELFPALSFDGQFFVNVEGDYTGTPDVTARAVTDAGESEADNDGRDFVRPDDWSI